MTRGGLLQLLTATPLAVLAGRDPPAADGEVRLYLAPGSYIIGERGGIWVSGHGVRIEGCTFKGCNAGVGDSIAIR